MKSRLFIQAGAMISIAVFLFLRSDLGNVQETVTQVDPLLLLGVMMLNVPVMVLLTVRSDLVLKHLGYYVPWNTLLPLTVLGNVAGSLTPAASGEFLRARGLCSHAAISAEDGI